MLRSFIYNMFEDFTRNFQMIQYKLHIHCALNNKIVLTFDKNL